MTRERVNVLWLFCEDLNPWLPLWGDSTVETPNIDALAAGGVRFTNAHTPSPVCSPSRSAVITGCMATSFGAHNHFSSRPGMPPLELPAQVRPLPLLMKDAGYYTFNHGKDDYNFEYDRDAYYSGKWQVVNPYGKHAPGNARGGQEDRDFRQWRGRAESQPFFGQITLWAGKNQLRVPGPAVDPSTVTVPPYYPNTGSFREAIARHYDQIRTTDREVGQIVADLKADGLLDNTIICFFSDHGYLMLRGKQFCYDSGTHSPLIIAGPAELLPEEQGTERPEVSTTLDITATTLALAGEPVPQWMESEDLFSEDAGRDFVISTRDRCDAAIDRIRSVRTDRFRYIRNFYTSKPLMQPQYRMNQPCYKEYRQMWQRGLLNQTQAFFAGDERLPEELYDCQTDPHECQNLANHPAYADELAHLREILTDWMRESGDRGGEKEADELYEWYFNNWPAEQTCSPEFKQFREHNRGTS